ncbi:hypothetical protein [Rubellicoccus peritrichatus]|uniref:Tetratricopeptide repeat protein n=1 Tax=Rubellicoccus peritrichatus TaxID=3080537 RepID=A0AAQ3L9G8_9BACT|nr:hypothetical protein [Puniceicoccus sp. CR14]WOO41840.1 hypothetical protein RZN69_01985 [Puniceicoccus sp. CR14]
MVKEEFEPGIRDPRKTRLIYGGIFLLVLIVLGASTLPAYRAFKKFRAHQMTEEAIIHLEKDNFEQAWEKAQTAYQLYPLDAEVARTAAKVYSRLDPSQAVAFWQEAYELSEDREDLIELIDAAILARQLDIAEENIKELKALGQPLGTAFYHEARLKLLEMDVTEAIAAAQQSLTEGGAPEDAPFLYIQLTQFSQDPAVRAEGIEYLRELARKPNTIGIKALRRIGAFPENTPDELREVIDAVNNHPARERNDLLYALELEMRLPDASAKDNLRKASELFNKDDLGELTEYGRWLNRQRRYGQTLEIITEKQALSRSDLFLVWADALAALDKWDKIGEVLSLSNLPIQRYQFLLFQARLYFETGQYDRGEFAWTRALLQVANQPRQLWYLEGYAMRLGLYEQARETLDRLTQLASTRREAYEKLVQLEQKHGSVESLREVLKRMSEAYPRDLMVKNDLAYANLLLNEEVQQSAEVARELVDDGSLFLANRITLALAYYRLGQMSKAAEVLDTLGIDWNQARPGFRAIYAAILRANGRTTDANKLLTNINVGALLKEEQELLGQTRG